MKNGGFRYIIRKNGFCEGYLIFCVNDIWVERLLLENGIDLQEFRRLSWEDFAVALENGKAKHIIEDLQPTDFWQLCDAVALSHAKFDFFAEGGRSIEGEDVYRSSWYKKYPFAVYEDLYERMLEEGYESGESLELMTYFVERSGNTPWQDWRDMIELCDVEGEMEEAMLHCVYLPPRDKMIREVVATLQRAVVLSRKRADSI